MHGYPKRRFHSVGDLARAVSALAGSSGRLAGLVTGRGEITPAFRERIMLVVTSVNRCRYCSFVHSLVALREGFDRREIAHLLDGELGETPPDEIEALLYAQHWADTAGRPEPAARAKLVEVYGEERARTIETAIRAIMFGNYFGNTVDGLLYSLSGGRLATPEP